MRWAFLVGLLALLSALGPSAARAAEMRAYTGTIEARHGDILGSKPTAEQVFLRTSGRVLRLPGRSLRAYDGRKVRVLARRRGRRLLRPRLMSTARPRQQQTVGHDPWWPPIHPILGTKRVAVLLAATEADAGRTWSAQRMDDLMFGPGFSVSEHIAAQSRGRATLAGDVLGWYTIEGPAGQCASYTYHDQAQQAATDAGVDLSQYDIVMTMFPREACGWNGMAGGSQAVINGEPPDFRLLAHEIGHTLNLHHGNALLCTANGAQTSMNAEPCRTGEYGDPFDVMGHAPRQLYSGFHRARVGWISEDEMPVGPPDETYALRSVNDERSGTKVLLVERPVEEQWSQYLGHRYFALEYRTAAGVFEDWAPDDPLVAGVTVRLAYGPGWMIQPELIDATPGSPAGHRDATLGVGRRLVDPATGMGFELRSISDGVAHVRVGYFPTAPSAVTAHLTGDEAAELRWERGTDDKEVWGYAIERDGQVVGHTAEPSYLDTGLPRGREVSYRVRTIDTDGNDTASETVSVTTPPLPGAPVTAPSTTVAVPDSTLPRLRLSTRIGRRLPRSRRLVLRGTDDRSGLLRITASLDGRRLRTARATRVVVRLPSRALRRRHRLVLTVTDAAGNRRVLRLRIVRGVLR